MSHSKCHFSHFGSCSTRIPLRKSTQITSKVRYYFLANKRDVQITECECNKPDVFFKLSKTEYRKFSLPPNLAILFCPVHMYLPTYLSACLPDYPSTWLPAYLTAYPSNWLPAYMTACLSTVLPAHLAACLLDYLPTWLPAYLTTHLGKVRAVCVGSSGRRQPSSHCRQPRQNCLGISVSGKLPRNVQSQLAFCGKMKRQS